MPRLIDSVTLQTICHCLSEDLAVRHVAIAALSSQPLRSAVFSLAARERLLPALHEALSGFSKDIPKSERIPLAIAHEANRRRNRQISGAVIELAATAAKRHGIEIVALKGAMWVLEEPARCAAWRPMVDIDVIAKPEDYEAMREILTQLNYRPARRERNFFGLRRFWWNHHLVSHRRDNDPFFVESHRHVCWQPALLPTDLIFENRRTIGAGLSLPRPWVALMHSIVHWQIHHYGYQLGLQRILDGLDIAKFLRRDDIDWDALMRHVERVGIRRQLNAALATATQLFGAQAPNRIASSNAGSRYVARVLKTRESRLRSWQAKQGQRILRLWDGQRFVYRMAVRQRSAAVTGVGLWGLRVWRLPLIFSHLLSVGMLHIAIFAVTVCRRIARPIRNSSHAPS